MGRGSRQNGRPESAGCPDGASVHYHQTDRRRGHDIPTLRDPDLLVYWREEVGGFITGGYERDPAPFGLNGIPRDFKYQLLPPDWERFTPLMENSIKRVPILENAEIRQLLNGPEGFTPDGEFLLGPTVCQRLLGCLRVLRTWTGRCGWHRQGHG